jgi:hypothetical protein
MPQDNSLDTRGLIGRDRELDLLRSLVEEADALGRCGDGVLHRARRWALSWGDLVMMHRQLAVLRSLAETTAGADRP